MVKGLSWIERVVLRSGTILVRLALTSTAWRFRSTSRVSHNASAIALWMIGLAASGVGLILHTSYCLTHLLGGFDRLPEGKVLDVDSFNSEVAPWRVPGRPREAA